MVLCTFSRKRKTLGELEFSLLDWISPLDKRITIEYTTNIMKTAASSWVSNTVRRANASPNDRIRSILHIQPKEHSDSARSEPSHIVVKDHKEFGERIELCNRQRTGRTPNKTIHTCNMWIVWMYWSLEKRKQEKSSRKSKIRPGFFFLVFGTRAVRKARMRDRSGLQTGTCRYHTACG